MRASDRRGGGALLWALLVALLLTAIGSVYLVVTQAQAVFALKSTARTEAMSIADSGLNLACRFLFIYREKGTWRWNDILSYNQAFADDRGAIHQEAMRILQNAGRGGWVVRTAPDAPVPPDPTAPTTSPPVIFGVHSLLNRGAWFILVRNNPEDPGGPVTDTDGLLHVTVFASHLDNIQVIVEASVCYRPSRLEPEAALMSRGGLSIVGNPVITAVAGSSDPANVLVDGNVAINGDPVIEGSVSATGTVDLRGSPNVRDGIREGIAPPPPFDVDPERYRSLAEAILHSDGTVADRDGRLLGVGDWEGFRFVGGSWRSEGAGAPPPPGVIYCETDLNLSRGTAFNNTFIVAGSVQVQGPGFGGAAVSSALGNISILSGGDIRVRGRVEFRGYVVAREQIDVDGTVLLRESGLLALNRSDEASLVRGVAGAAVKISGNVRIEYRPRLGTFVDSDTHSLRVVFLRKK